MTHIHAEREGAVLRLMIDRPEKKNALTSAMYTALSDAVVQAESDAGIRVLLLHGVGDAFTAGNDLLDFLQNPWPEEGVPPAVHFMCAVAAAKKPVVAAVQGIAVGIGVTILLHCDLVYAAEGATFLTQFVNLGIVPEAGSSLLLPALVGHQRAAELLMLAAPFSAQRAYEMGLVNAVVAPQVLLATATAAAHKLAEKPAAALRATKELLKRPAQAAVELAIREELAVLRERLVAPDTREALSAFLEKRKPDFSKFA